MLCTLVLVLRVLRVQSLAAACRRAAAHSCSPPPLLLLLVLLELLLLPPLPSPPWRSRAALHRQRRLQALPLPAGPS